jgi:hypothetical protein
MVSLDMRRQTKPKDSLLDFFQRSPLRNAALDLERLDEPIQTLDEPFQDHVEDYGEEHDSSPGT